MTNTATPKVEVDSAVLLKKMSFVEVLKVLSPRCQADFLANPMTVGNFKPRGLKDNKPVTR